MGAPLIFVNGLSGLITDLSNPDAWWDPGNETYGRKPTLGDHAEIQGPATSGTLECMGLSFSGAGSVVGTSESPIVMRCYLAVGSGSSVSHVRFRLTSMEFSASQMSAVHGCSFEFYEDVSNLEAPILLSLYQHGAHGTPADDEVLFGRPNLGSFGTLPRPAGLRLEATR